MKSNCETWIVDNLRFRTWALAVLCVCAGWPCGVLGQNENRDEPGFASKLQQRAEEFRKPAVIKFEGPIDARRFKYFNNRLARAQAAGADLLILEIDSPGGLAFESLEIAETLRDIQWAYTVAYIPREAISGAALMSLGCDEIIMGPEARIGDVGIIQFDIQLFAFRYAPAKATSMLVRQARDLATAKGRPQELAEAMIDKDVLVFRKKDAPPATRPEFTVVRLESENQNPMEAARKSGLDLTQWTLIEESGPQRFLTINARTAVELGVAQHITDSRVEILREFNATGAVTEHRYAFTDDVVHVLNSWWATTFLIIIGLIALYIELSAPGVGAGGMIAGLCAALFFWSRFLGGTSTWLEVILFLSGVAFLLMELFVIPGWGISGLIGLILIFVSVVMAGQNFVFPQTEREWNQLLTSILVILCSGCIVLIAASFISKKLGAIPVVNRLLLNPKTSTRIDMESGDKLSNKPLPQAHPLVSVGDWGTSESLLRPAGRAKFGHHSVDVVSDGAFIEPGTQVRVVDISGNRIVVAEIESTHETATKNA